MRLHIFFVSFLSSNKEEFDRNALIFHENLIKHLKYSRANTIINTQKNAKKTIEFSGFKFLEIYKTIYIKGNFSKKNSLLGIKFGTTMEKNAF